MANRRKILIVDDELRICDGLKSLLSAQGYAVQTCYSGGEALNSLGEDEFDLILLDIYMKKMDGFCVVERMPPRNIDTTVIIMTGNASSDSAIKALRMGAYDYLKKPFDYDEFFTAVRKAIEKTRVKRRVDESKAKYRRLIENQTNLVINLDIKGRFQFVNSCCCDILNRSEQDLLGRQFISFVHADDRVMTAKALKSIQVSSTSECIQNRLMTKSGWRWFSWMNSAVLNRDRKFVSVVGFGKEITDKKKRDIKLLKSEQKYRVLFETSADAISVIDSETGKFVDCNDAALKMHGLGSPRELIGLSLPDMSPEYQPNDELSLNVFIRLLQRARIEGHVVFEWALRCGGKGGLCFALVSLTFMEMDHRAFYLIIAKDITLQKQGEQVKVRLISQLERVLEEIKILKGIIPICSQCKKIRDGKGHWEPLEVYIEQHSDVKFSHGLCSECADTLYGDEDWYIKMESEKSSKK